MPCEYLPVPGGVAIVCSRGRRSRRKCRVCGWRIADFLCDAPKAPPKTCDAPLCEVCRVQHGDGVDYCPSCSEKSKASPAPARAPSPAVEQLELFGEVG
jgi:hypothetical protein